MICWTPSPSTGAMKMLKSGKGGKAKEGKRKGVGKSLSLLSFLNLIYLKLIFLFFYFTFTL